jgi:hypothetical protein
MEATMDEDTEQEQVHPLDEPTQPVQREPEPVVARRGRGLGANRHLGSIVLSFLAVLGGYGALDYGFYRANAAASVDQFDGALPDRTMIALGVAGACLLVAAAAGRISALGPLLAGLVLGVAPAAWVFLDFASYVRRLDDVPEMWEHTTFGMSYVAFAVYPVVGGLLLGAALAGRWRRPPPVTT